MELPRQEYWSGLQFPTPGYLPNPGTESQSPVSLALAGGFFTNSATWEEKMALNSSRVISYCFSVRSLLLCSLFVSFFKLCMLY